MSETRSTEFVEQADAETDRQPAGETSGPDIPELTQTVMQAWMQHEIGESLPVIPSEIIPDIAPTPTDVEISARLLESYAACAREREYHARAAPDLWTSIRKLQRHFLALLANGDPEALAGYLCNMARHDATIGITQGIQEYDLIAANPDYAYFRLLLIKDKLVSFAEAAGAIGYECPEQGPWGEHLHRDIDDLLEALEARVGISLTPPPIDGGLIKIRAGRGLFHDRDLHAQFSAWSMRELLGPGAAVCEIGGGVGRCAYWTQQFGLGRHTLVDLPHVNVLQGYYALKSMPWNAVHLFGETGGTARIRILPDFARDEIATDDVEIVFNQDGLPEFHHAAARDYIRWSRRISRKWLYSINQESAAAYTQEFCALAGDDDPRQNVIGALVEDIGGFRRVMRAPYWLRKGYVAELFRVA